MADRSLARRYARALVAIGREQNCIERIGADLTSFTSALDGGDGILRSVLPNPGLTVGERRGVLDQVLLHLDLHVYVNNFLRLLVDKSRFDSLDDIVREYALMADELANRVRASVTTAAPLQPGMGQDIQKALQQSTGKTVIVTFRVDPSLIGGMVAKVGDKVYDASVSSRFEQVQFSLVAAAAEA